MFWARIRNKDVVATTLMSLAGIFIMIGYELIRSSSNSLFQAVYGAKGLSGALAFVPIFALIALMAYDRVLTRLGARLAAMITTLICFLILLFLWWGISSGQDRLRYALVIFREVYIMIIVEQYYSFMTSTLSKKSAGLLLSIFGALGSVGAMLGGVITTNIALQYGTIWLPLIAAAGLLPATYLANLAHRACGEPQPERLPTGEVIRSAFLGLPLFKRNPVLVFIFILVICTQAIATVSNLYFQYQLQASYPVMDEQTAFSGRFYAWLNIATLVGQLAIAPVLLKFFSPIKIQLALPLLHFATHLWAFLTPSLFSAGAAFLLFKSLDYSVFRASKEILYMPLNYDARFRAKELIDVFGYRFSKGATSFLFFSIERMSFFTLGIFPASGCAFALLWLFSGLRLTKKSPPAG